MSKGAFDVGIGFVEGLEDRGDAVGSEVGALSTAFGRRGWFVGFGRHSFESRAKAESLCTVRFEAKRGVFQGKRAQNG